MHHFTYIFDRSLLEVVSAPSIFSMDLFIRLKTKKLDPSVDLRVGSKERVMVRSREAEEGKKDTPCYANLCLPRGGQRYTSKEFVNVFYSFCLSWTWVLNVFFANLIDRQRICHPHATIIIDSSHCGALMRKRERKSSVSRWWAREKQSWWRSFSNHGRQLGVSPTRGP